MIKHKEKIIKHYNQTYAEVYDGLMNIPIYRRFIKNAIDDLDPVDSSSYLVIGCGTGNGIRELSKRVKNPRVTGIDISEKMLKEAKEKNKGKISNLELKLMDAEDLKFEDNSFDNVISLHTLGELDDPIKGTKEWLRVLKPGGKFVVTYPLDAKIAVLYLKSIKDILGYIKKGKIRELYRDLKTSSKISSANKPITKIRKENSQYIPQILKIIKEKSNDLNKPSGYGGQDLVLSGKLNEEI